MPSGVTRERVANLLDELPTLAHEYGHAVSERRGGRTPDYRAAIDVSSEQWPHRLTDEQRRLIFAEEATAWALG